MIEGVVLRLHVHPDDVIQPAHLKSQKIEYLIEEENEIMSRGAYPNTTSDYEWKSTSKNRVNRLQISFNA